MQKHSRRSFVKAVAIGVGASPLVPVFAATPWQFFTAAEAELVDALCEQIVPGDEDPGAHDTRVVRFIDKQLQGPYRRHQEEYRNGLIGVDETSQEKFNKMFLQLSWEEQTEVMRALESGKTSTKTWKEQPASNFFNMLRNHSLQGFYGSPRHGGNRHYASYRMLGLDYPQIIGQNRYR